MHTWLKIHFFFKREHIGEELERGSLFREGDGRLGGPPLQVRYESLLPPESVDLPGTQTEGGDWHGVEPEHPAPTHPPLFPCASG